MTTTISAAPKHEPKSSSCALLERLDQQLAETLARVVRAEYIRDMEDTNADPQHTIAFMREVMLEIWSYQKPITEALFTAVGRIGDSIDEQALVRDMISVQVEEIGHGRLALLDYIALGGDEVLARTRRPSPPAQAFIAVIRQLCEREDPLSHLGLMYFLEQFTVPITGRVGRHLQAKGYPNDKLQFMRLHAEEDIRHSDILANVIGDAMRRYPSADTAIQYGFDCFAQIYPDPIWQHAWERSQRAFR